MKVTREVLLEQVSGIYAAGAVTLNGRYYFAFASENRNGGLYLVDAETKEVWKVEGCSGGVMAIIDAEDEDSFICIEEFYPVFDSESACLVRYTVPSEDRCAKILREVIVEIPYVHRIAQICGSDGIYLAAGRLCKHKKYVEDWSTSGSMEIAKYDRRHSGPVEFKNIFDGIHKHHALWIRNVNGADELFYGGTEGVFRSFRKDAGWITEHIISVPTSDVVAEDLDGDGEEEIAVIEGFHGDQCTIFKKQNGAWERVLELPMKFGHVLWGGSFLGEPALIIGSRDGKKELVLCRFRHTLDGGMQIKEETVIDSGQAPAQIFIIGKETGTALIAANHGAGEAVIYRFG